MMPGIESARVLAQNWLDCVREVSDGAHVLNEVTPTPVPLTPQFELRFSVGGGGVQLFFGNISQKSLATNWCRPRGGARYSRWASRENSVSSFR